MDRPFLELTSNLSWNLAFRCDVYARLTEDKTGFFPIPAQKFRSPSNRLLIGTVSDNAPSSWYLGCRVNVHLDLGQFDVTTRFGNLGEIHQDKVGLKKLRYVEWHDYGFPSYDVILDPPFWLPHFYAEAWWYDGSASSSYEQSLTRLEAQMTRIESRLDELQSGSGGSGANNDNDLGGAL